MHLYSQWFHFPLLKPNVPIDDYRDKKGNNYSFWLEKTFSGLIKSDSLCPQPVKVNSHELRQYLSWKRRGYKIIVKQKEDKVIKVVKVSFPKGNKVYEQLDAKLIEQELRDVKFTIDMYDCDLTKLRHSMEVFYKELKPLIRWFLHKEKDEINKRITIRSKYIPYYLKTYDTRREKTYRLMHIDKNQQRKFKEHVRFAKALIRGEWHYI